MKIVDGKRSANWWDCLQFEDDIPIPPSQGAYAEAVKGMKVGQSFLIDYTRQPVAGNLARATGWKFQQAKEGDKLRIWRIK